MLIEGEEVIIKDKEERYQVIKAILSGVVVDACIEGDDWEFYQRKKFKKEY